jgi:hypothetical protein
MTEARQNGWEGSTCAGRIAPLTPSLDARTLAIEGSQVDPQGRRPRNGRPRRDAPPPPQNLTNLIRTSPQLGPLSIAFRQRTDLAKRRPALDWSGMRHANGGFEAVNSTHWVSLKGRFLPAAPAISTPKSCHQT